MKNSESYIPKQPFFEGVGTNFHSKFCPVEGLLAQYYSFQVPNHAQAPIVAVPDGTIDLLFHCDEEQPRAYVCGSVKTGTIVPFESGKSYFGARFFPSAAERLLHCSLDEFTEKQIPLEDVLPQFSGMIDDICLAGSFEEQVSLVERLHSAGMDEKNPVPMLVRYLLDQIHHTHGEVRIGSLEDKTGYTTRHLTNVFKKHVGLSPKLYARTVRFQRVFDLVKNQSALDFAGIAEDAGYFDQAHFINEFKTFSLTTPRQVFCA